MDLLQLLRQISRNQSPIRLLNIYKGLPISYDTNIISVGFSEIQVPGSKNHIACLYYQGESYLQADDFPFVIRSTVKSLNLVQNYAVLTDFEVAQNNIGKRNKFGSSLMTRLSFPSNSEVLHMISLRRWLIFQQAEPVSFLMTFYFPPA
jgi:hypothetical protein